MNWFRRLFRKRKPREVVFVQWAEADKMLCENAGWRIAREEDQNREIGRVWLERDIEGQS